jgi:serine/threonine protein kinase/tetratricopeptide (TPR) repeat protein
MELDQLLIGTTLSHFRITAKLGQGGMGEVYRAEDTQLGRQVAIKVLPAEMANDSERLERFRREARSLAALDHPNIVPVHSVEVVGGEHLLVMGLIEGSTLDELISERGMPLEQFLDTAIPIADALVAAHAKGITHRDLKPSNVMVGDDGRVRVLDFGLAKLVEETKDPGLTQLPTEVLTEQGVVMGTVPYMSPEQIEGKPVDPRTDIFSLGVLLYEMVTGKRPFEGDTSPALMSSILKDTPPQISSRRVDLPRHLDRVIQRCIEKEPDQRLQTARDVLNELTGLRDELRTGLTHETPAQVGSRPSTARWIWVAGGVAAVVLTAVLILVFGVGDRRQASPTGESAPLQSLAVLPLENLSAEPEQEYFADGMTDTLITELAKIEALKVISRTSSMQYKDTVKSLPQIGRELGVQGIIEGTVLRAGDRIRVTAQLIDADSDQHLWAESYDRQMDDVLALYSEVARAIAREVQIAVTPDDEARLAAERPVDPEAYDALLRGRHLVQSGAGEEGLELLRKAIELDPEYAAAWAQIADRYSSLAIGDPVWLPEARAAAWRALELDPQLAEGHAVLGSIAFYHDWDWDTARRELERAMELNPGLTDAHQAYGDYLEVLGQWSESIAVGIRSVEVDPISAGLRLNLGLTYNMARRFDEALAICQSALELAPQASWAWHCIADAYNGLGALEDALAAAKRGVQLNPERPFLQVILARQYAAVGRRDEAQEVLDRLETASQDQYVSPFYLAWIHTHLGNHDEALAYLDQAVESHAAYTPWINSIADFDPLRADPRFQELLRRLNLAD